MTKTKSSGVSVELAERGNPSGKPDVGSGLETPYPPLADAEWPAEIADMLSGFAGRLNVYRVMAHNPALLRSWAGFRDYVVVRNALGAQRSEIAILRVGHRLGASYEWMHHVCRARAYGMDDARILSVRGEPDTMAPEDAVIARAVDDLIDHARLSPPVHEALAGLVGAHGVFDVIATVGLYSTLAFIVRSFDTPVDGDIATQLAERPIG
jgi:alkylhydroperoxidase family enzyme